VFPGAIRTREALKERVHIIIISGKQYDMGVWRDIQPHPTRPHPLLLPLAQLKPCPQVINVFLPAKHTYRAADLQEQQFSLFFLDSSIYHYSQQVSWSEDEQLCMSFPEMAQLICNNTCTCKLFCFSTLCYCTANSTTVHSSRCCSSFISVVLT